MPIRGLTERKRLPRILKIHLGEPPNGERGYPTKTDHFVVHDDDPLAPLFHEVYGPEPKELRIIFPPASEPGKTEAECCANQYFYAYGSGTGRICKGDGYKAEALLDTDKMKETGGEVQLACWATSKSQHVALHSIDCGGSGYDGGRPCPMFETKRCKRLMMLQFFLDGLPPDGICQIDTSSINSIRNINDTLNMVEKLTGGRISLIPMKLRLVPKDVTHEGKKVRVYVLQLQTDWQLVQLIDAAEKPRAQFLLPAADDQVPEDLFPEDDEEEGATPVEGEIIPPEEEATAKAAQAVGDPAPVQGSLAPAPAERPAVRGGEEHPDIARTPTRAARAPAGNPSSWKDDWTALSRRAADMGFTEKMVLDYLGIAEPKDFEQLRHGRPVQVCVAGLTALKRASVTQTPNIPLEEMVQRVVAQREGNGKPA